MNRLAKVLASSNAFVQTDERRWQLGGAGANFGGVLEGAAILEQGRPPRPPFELLPPKPQRHPASDPPE